MLKNMQDQISKIQNDWKVILKEEIGKEYFKKIGQFICKEKKNKTIFNTKFSKHTLNILIYAIRTKNKHLILIFTVFMLYFQNWFNYFIFWSI
jgi:hypothetical protein